MIAEKQLPYDITSKGKMTKFEGENNFVQLEFGFKPHKKNSQASLLNTNQHIIIVLDKSGSMSGGAIKSAKEGILDMVTYLHSAQCKNISLITYESHATLEETLGKSLDTILTTIKKIEAGGGTSFRSAFDQIKKSIINKKSSDAKIVFFTDGEDGDAMNALGELKAFIKTCPSTEFHTIGFTASHNVQLLTALTAIGNKPGTFQYCKESKDIKVCVESVTGLIGTGSILANLIINKNKIPLEMEEQLGEEETIQYKTNLFLTTEEIGQGLNIIFVIGDAQKEILISLENIKKSETEESNPIMLKVIYYKNEVGKVLKSSLDLNKEGKFNKELYDTLIKKIEGLNTELDALSLEGNKLKNFERKEFFPILYEIKELVGEFYAHLKEFQSGQIDNDKVASLNALAYRKMAKKGLQKKLDVRTQNNVSVINQVYQKVKELCGKIDAQDLTTRYGDLSKKIGECIYSANNFIEALKDEDCLCLTYDISRSEAAVMDPTQVIIKDVLPSFIGVAPFLASAEYAVKTNPEAHGGFNKQQQGSIIKGVAREDITGVLPLFICPEHWEVARQLIKPALGWTVTLDPLGYASSQVRTVPFLVLSKLYNKRITEGSTEFLDFQIQLVEETCIQIIKESSGEKADVKLNEEIIRLFKGYTSDPLLRTVDSIASNQVFLVQLYLLTKMKQIELPGNEELERFFEAVGEEEMRRRTKPYEPDVNTSSTIYDLLNVDTERYVTIPFKQYIDSLNADKGEEKSEYATKFLALINAQGQEVEKVEVVEKVGMVEKDDENTKENVPEKSTKPEITKLDYEISLSNNGTYKPTQLNAIDELNKTKNFSLLVLNLRSIFGLPLNNTQFVLSPETENTLISLYIQNKLGARNADRRDNVSNKTYQNPFTEGADFIRKTYIKLAEEERLRKINEYISASASSASAEIANKWIITKDLIEAGGLIHGVTIGNSMTYFYRALCTGTATNFKDKLYMLIKGEYKGVKLYIDKYEVNQAPPQGWKDISHRHSNKLFAANFMKLNKEEWMGILPKLREKFIDSLIV